MTARTSLPVAVAQLNGIAGDLEGNAGKIRRAARRATDAGALLLVTPELALTGGRVGALAGNAEFMSRVAASLEALSDTLSGGSIPVLVGTLQETERGVQSALAFIEPGKPIRTLSLRDLDHCGPGTESRIRLGEATVLVSLGCPEEPQTAAERCDAEIRVEMEPFCGAVPEQVADGHDGRTVRPRLSVNPAGGFDGGVYPGGSALTDGSARLARRMNFFEEDFAVFDLFEKSEPESAPQAPGRMELLYRALVAATRDYVLKSGFKAVTLGLSGGVDSALVATIAADALGPQNVHCVMMPTRFTSGQSISEATEFVRRRGFPYVVTPIEPLFNAFLTALAPTFENRPWDVTEENLQARVRGMLLMAYSNKFGRLVLATGNKSECAVGYSTLYGDTAGAFAPICDVLKTDVWELCRWRNAQAGGPVIPEQIIDRAPSAELREGQTDQQSLPPYEVLDAIIRGYVERRQSAAQIAKTGIDEALVRKVVGMIHRAEYKRRQCPPGPRLSAVSFACGWNYPLGLKS